MFTKFIRTGLEPTTSYLVNKYSTVWSRCGIFNHFTKMSIASLVLRTCEKVFEYWANFVNSLVINPSLNKLVSELYEMRCPVWYQLYNFKNVGNTLGGQLHLVKL